MYMDIVTSRILLLLLIFLYDLTILLQGLFKFCLSEIHLFLCLFNLFQFIDFYLFIVKKNVFN